MKVLGVCGLIGSGKSYVMRLLETLYDFPTYDCDSRAKELYFEPVVRTAVIDTFHQDPVTVDGQLRRDFLGSLLQNEESKKELERIVHLAVDHDFEQWKQRNSEEQVVVAESAIMFTSGFFRFCDKVLEVRASEDVRRYRVNGRDAGKGEGYFERVKMLQRVEAIRQRDNSDYFVDNNGAESLVLQLEQVISALLGEERKV